MKRYKLLKDTPTIKAGTIFEEVVSDFDELKELVRITPVGAKTSPQWTIQDINNFNEWFEEIKKFEEWEPKDGEDFIYLDCCGELCCQKYFSDDDVSHHTTSVGNAYPLDTPDELIIKEQKLIPQAMHRLKMAAKKAWFEFNCSEGPDWSNCGQYKYYIYYNWSVSNKGFHVVDTDSANVFGCIYFPTKEAAQWVIDNMRDDLKLVMGIE